MFEKFLKNNLMTIQAIHYHRIIILNDQKPSKSKLIRHLLLLCKEIRKENFKIVILT